MKKIGPLLLGAAVMLLVPPPVNIGSMIWLIAIGAFDEILS